MTSPAALTNPPNKPRRRTRILGTIIAILAIAAMGVAFAATGIFDDSGNVVVAHVVLEGWPAVKPSAGRC